MRLAKQNRHCCSCRDGSIISVSAIPALLTTLLLLITLSISVNGEAAVDAGDEILEHATDSWTGDLDGITERGFLRILTVHNPLFFSFDGAEQRGMVAEWAAR